MWKKISNTKVRPLDLIKAFYTTLAERVSLQQWRRKNSRAFSFHPLKIKSSSRHRSPRVFSHRFREKTLRRCLPILYDTQTHFDIGAVRHFRKFNRVNKIFKMPNDKIGNTGSSGQVTYLNNDTFVPRLRFFQGLVTKRLK